MNTMRTYHAQKRSPAGISFKFLKTNSVCLCLLCLMIFGADAQVVLPAQVGSEFWISTNATGLTYQSGVIYSNGVPATGGTIDAPLDGSSTNFDYNMARMPYNCTIHLMGGTYLTEGWDAWGLETGQKLIGSGIDVTIVKMVPSGSLHMTAISSHHVVTNCTVCNLTCDCNGITNTTAQMAGVNLVGSFITIDHVKVINVDNGNVEETWAINVGDDGFSDGVHNVIENCIVSDGQGSISSPYGYDAIGFNGSGIIKDNYVFGNILWAGLNISWAHDLLFEGNYIANVSTAVYNDTGGNTNILISHNMFKDVGSGVSMGGPSNVEKNVTIAFNYIEITNMLAYPSAFQFDWANGISTNILLFGNNVTYVGASSATPLFINDSGYGFVGLVADDNRIDDIFTNAFTVPNDQNLVMYNNFDLFGNLQPNCNNSLGGYPVTSIGYGLLDSTNSSQALTYLGLPGNPTLIVTNNSAGVSLNGSFNGNGAGLTNLSASTINSGTLPASVLPSSGVWNTTMAITNNGSLAVSNLTATATTVSNLTATAGTFSSAGATNFSMLSPGGFTSTIFTGTNYITAPTNGSIFVYATTNILAGGGGAAINWTLWTNGYGVNPNKFAYWPMSIILKKGWSLSFGANMPGAVPFYDLQTISF